MPELAGCAADGPTYAAALEAVEAVIAAWIATTRELDRSTPTPKGRLIFTWLTFGAQSARPLARVGTDIAAQHH